MTDTRYGPDQPCQRRACIRDTPAPGGQVAAHVGGAHLDPYNRELYDGPVTLVRALPHTVRDAFRPLMNLAGSYTDRYNDDGTKADTELRAAADLAIDTAGREIDRLRQQVAHVQVDADRKIRAAYAAANDCTDHGHTITALHGQLAAAHADRDRVEAARLILLSEHQTIREVLDNRAEPFTRDQLIDTLDRINTRTAAAHRRKFNT